MIRRLYHLWPKPGILIRLGLLHIILAILQGLLLALLVPVLTALLQPKPDFAAARPWLIAGGIGLVMYVLFTLIATPIGFAASMKLAAQLRNHLMRHVTTLPLGWFTTHHKARLARAMTADVGSIAQLAVTIGAPAITAVTVSLTIILVTFILDWRMALLFSAIIPFAWMSLRHAGRVASRAEIELEEAATEIAGRAIELAKAQTVLRAAGKAGSGSAQMLHALEDHHQTYKQGLRRSMFPDLAYTTVIMFGFAAILVQGSILLLGGSLSIPAAIGLLVLSIRFLEPLGSLIELIGALRAMDNAITRLQFILYTRPLPAAKNPVTQLQQYDLEFSNVYFSYGEVYALTDISFKCPAGTTTAIIGPSGSGKTTITHLIARFFDVSAGSVRIGGQDVRNIQPSTLMKEIAIIFQEVYLFDGSIMDNLLLANAQASMADLETASAAARLDEVVARLPDGWQTQVGEGGAQLSGGERQRVSIARAFLKNARIVLIDEASSALDPENECAVSEAIANLAADPERTVIIIAHSPATIKAADQIISLYHGCITEMGKPEELLQTNGNFSRIYHQYEQARSWHIIPA